MPSQQPSGVSREIVFKLVMRGWFAGVFVIFVPILLIASVARAIAAPALWGEALLGFLLVPLIAAGQSVIVGGLVVLGLTVWPPKPKPDSK